MSELTIYIIIWTYSAGFLLSLYPVMYPIIESNPTFKTVSLGVLQLFSWPVVWLTLGVFKGLEKFLGVGK